RAQACPRRSRRRSGRPAATRSTTARATRAPGRRRLPVIRLAGRLLSPSTLRHSRHLSKRPDPAYVRKPSGFNRAKTGDRDRESPGATRHRGARVTRRLSPHSEHTPYSLTNPPARAIRVAARCPVDGSIPTARPRHRSQKNRPRWASRNAATLSLAIMAEEAPPEPDGPGVRTFIGGPILLDGDSPSRHL